MSPALNNLLSQAMALPEGERAQIALRLLESLDPPGREYSASEWEGELNRRAAAATSGAELGIPADEVFEEAKRALGEA
ncbi:MAG: addiction module protein [Gemmataceae bacterium]